MESKKKVKPMVVCLLVLMSLLLVFCCVISVGVTKLQIGELRYQIHLVVENSLTGGVGRGDFLLLDRQATVQTGSVVYLPNQDAYQGVSMVSGSQVKLTDGKVTRDVIPVQFKISLLAPVMCFLQDYPYVSFAVAAGYIVLLIVVKATAPARWKKRQQKLIRENFAKFGAQYAKEDENLQY